MKMQEFFSTVKGMTFENKFNRIVIGALLVLNLVLGLSLSSKKPVVVLIPPEISEETIIGQNAASASYKQAWAMFMASMVGNVTPGNVDFVKRTLEKMLDPRLYHATQEDLEKQARLIAEENLAVSFLPDAVLYQPETDRIFVTGSSVTTGPYGQPSQEKKTYEIEVTIKNYRPVYTYLDSYRGGPKTKEALQQMLKNEGETR